MKLVEFWRKNVQRLINHCPDQPQRMPRRHASLAAHIAEQTARLFVRPTHSLPPPLQAQRITIRPHEREFFGSLLVVQF